MFRTSFGVAGSLAGCALAQDAAVCHFTWQPARAPMVDGLRRSDYACQKVEAHGKASVQLACRRSSTRHK